MCLTVPQGGQAVQCLGGQGVSGGGDGQGDQDLIAVEAGIVAAQMADLHRLDGLDGRPGDEMGLLADARQRLQGVEQSGGGRPHELAGLSGDDAPVGQLDGGGRFPGLLRPLLCRSDDRADVGRYKFNKKLALWNRLAGQKLAAPVADPTTGEIVAEVGEVLTRERAQMLDALGVNEAVVEVEDLHTGVHLVKVFSNNMVDMKGFVDFDPEEAGVTEKVRFTVLRELLEQRDSEGMSDPGADGRPHPQTHHRGRHDGFH